MRRIRPLFLLLPVLSLLCCISCNPGADETRAEAKYLAEAKHWDKKVLKQLENAEAELTTSWAAGRMHYTLKVSPYNGSFERYIKDTLADNRLSLNVDDMGGLNLLTVDIPVKKMTPTADGKGEPAALQASGDVRCTRQMYKAITDWSLSWSFPLKH